MIASLRRSVRTVLCVGALLLSCTCCREQASEAQAQAAASAPDVRVEFFGAEHGYTVGTEPVTLLCVVRNVGVSALAEKTLRLRCFAMTGLDYREGSYALPLPALGCNQAAAFRWRLTPSEGRGPLIAAALIERATVSLPNRDGAATQAAMPRGGPQAAAPPPPENSSFVPQATLTIVPRFVSSPHFGLETAALASGLRAGVTPNGAEISNDRVAARVVSAEGKQPVLLLLGREATAWRALATGVPLIQTRSGEDGQIPWWEIFRWRESRVTAGKEAATLTLVGDIGTQWRAELTLEARRDTGGLNGTLHLKARKTMRLWSLQLPRLLPLMDEQVLASSRADGSLLTVTPVEPILPMDAAVAAAHSGEFTFGLAWPGSPFLPGGRWQRLPAPDAVLANILGAQGEADPRGEQILAGATVRLTFRLFAFRPSDTVRDALRFALPVAP